MVRTREQAARMAEQSRSAKVGMCQLWTRTMFNAPSVGDVDKDGDADAVDGWKKEPERYRHPGDRNPPRGTPVAWSGGSRGFGHRAISLGRKQIRSIDVNGPNTVGTADLEFFEKRWGMRYLGWSETISGILIPGGPAALYPDGPDLPKTAPKSTPEKEVEPKSKRKTVAQIAREVIKGEWGNGAVRISRLKKAGYDPEEVQAKVNAFLGH